MTWDYVETMAVRNNKGRVSVSLHESFYISWQVSYSKPLYINLKTFLWRYATWKWNINLLKHVKILGFVLDSISSRLKLKMLLNY